MDIETQLLSRVAANHLYLAQFEPLRAILLALRTRNPDLALAILQTIVAHSGRFQNVLWSTSCPSPSLLTYLSTLELLQFNNPSSPWSFDPETLRLRAEFLLFVQNLRDRVSAFDRTDGNGELGDCLRVLDRVLELGVKRLKADGNVKAEDCVEEAELMCLSLVIFDSADVYDALCWNIHKQIQEWGGDDKGMAITVRKDGEGPTQEDEDDLKLLGLIQRSVQVAHLDAMKECLKEGDVEGAVSRIRFLHLDFGVEEAEYRCVYCLLRICP